MRTNRIYCSNVQEAEILLLLPHNQNVFLQRFLPIAVCCHFIFFLLVVVPQPFLFHLPSVRNFTINYDGKMEENTKKYIGNEMLKETETQMQKCYFARVTRWAEMMLNWVNVHSAQCVQARRNIFCRRCFCHCCCCFCRVVFLFRSEFSLAGHFVIWASWRVRGNFCWLPLSLCLRNMCYVLCSLKVIFPYVWVCMCAVYHFFCSYSCSCLLLAQFGFGIAIVNSLCQTGGKV